jgi:hypothetical protein
MSEDDDAQFENVMKNPYCDDPVWQPWHADAPDMQGGADDDPVLIQIRIRNPASMLRIRNRDPKPSINVADPEPGSSAVLTPGYHIWNMFFPDPTIL